MQLAMSPGLVDDMKFAAVIAWLMARKPWEIDISEDGNTQNTIVKASTKSMLTGRTVALGFVWSKQSKQQPDASTEYAKYLHALHNSMAQVLAAEGIRDDVEFAFDDK